MDNIDEILTDLYLMGNTYEYQEPQYQEVAQAKQALLEIILREKPKKENIKDLCHCDTSLGILDHIDNLIKCENCGKQLGFRTWNSCIDEYEKKIMELFK